MTEVMVDRELAIACGFGDIFRCTHCGRIIVAWDLSPRQGNRPPRPDMQWKVWEDFHLYCYCEDRRAKAYQPGDGTIVLGGNVEVIVSEDEVEVDYQI